VPQTGKKRKKNNNELAKQRGETKNELAKQRGEIKKSSRKQKENKSASAGNRTRGARMGILHVGGEL
jgi:hypothetical protein